MSQIRVERPADGVVRMVLDHPERRNAMSEEMGAAWVEVVDQLRGDRSVRVVVVTGADGAFSSGGDLSWLVAEPEATVDELRERMLAYYRMWLRIRDLEVPTIAAINGPAIGAGLCLALACDLRFAARGARMGAPFVKLGLHPGMAGTHLLPDVVGPAMARDLLLTGRLVDGEEALSMGLVTRLFEADTFGDDVLAVAQEVAATAPLASRLTKVALADGGHSTVAAALQWDALAQPVTMTTTDLLEGISAAQERRAPRFEGR